MLQAFIRLGWIGALCAGLLSPATRLAAPDPPGLTLRVECSSGGSVHIGGPIETDIVGEGKTIELSEAADLSIELQADPGFEIESAQIDGQRQQEAVGKSSHRFELRVESDRTIDVVFKTPAAVSEPGQEDSFLVPPLAARLNLNPAQWRQMLEDYQHGNTYPWKAARLQAAALLEIEKWVDEDGFVLEGYAACHSLRALQQAGGAICCRMWIESEAPGRISAPNTSAGSMARARSLGLTVASVQFYSNILMPGGNYISNEYWTLSNGQKAFCASYIKASPYAGQPVSDPVEADLPALRKALYYSYGGPDNRLAARGFASAAQQIVATNDLVSMAYTGGCIAKNEAGGVNWNACIRTLWEYIQTLPDPAGYKAFICDVPGTGTNHHGQSTGFQPLAYGKIAGKGALRIRKVSALPGISEAGGSNYSLQGAKYAVRQGSDFASSRPVTTLTIDSSGQSESVELESGAYWVQEIEAPAGYVLDATPISVQVRAGTTVTAPTQVTLGEQPKYARPWLALQKINSRTGQGERALRGAIFRVCYYSLPPEAADSIEHARPVRSWRMQTDDKGQILMGDSYRVDGDDFFRNAKNEPVFPIGIVTFQEEQAPDGYEINDQLFKVAIAPDPAPSVQICTWNVPSVPEQPVGIVLLKMDENWNRYLPGAVFDLMDPQLRHTRYTTDKNGKIALRFEKTGQYLLQEVRAPKGYQVSDQAVVITVEADSITCNVPAAGSMITFTNSTLLVRNRPNENELRIVKVDEQQNPLAGARFDLFRRQDRKERIAWRTSGSDGLMSFGSLGEGTYWLAETRAPEGFDLELDEQGLPRLHRIDLEIDPDTGVYRCRVDGEQVRENSDGLFTLKQENGIAVLQARWPNRKGYGPALPQTGGVCALWCLSAGSIVSIGTACAKRHGKAGS